MKIFKNSKKKKWILEVDEFSKLNYKRLMGSPGQVAKSIVSIFKIASSFLQFFFQFKWPSDLKEMIKLFWVYITN